MPMFRADFDVNSSLVFGEVAEPLSLDGGDGSISIKIRNSKPDAEGHVPCLQATVIGNSADIQTAGTDLRLALANHLDALAYVTQANIQIVRCWRVIEWEPFQTRRVLYASQTFDANYPPSPELPVECIETASAMIASGLPNYVQRALRYYRLGLLAKYSEDQFGHFWSTIETMAEGRKTATPKPIECPKCGGSLHCRTCETVPLRKPMALEAIREMLGEIVPSQHLRTVYKRLTDTRHCLVHVRPIAALEAELGQPLSILVNQAAIANATRSRTRLLFADYQETTDRNVAGQGIRL